MRIITLDVNNRVICVVDRGDGYSLSDYERISDGGNLGQYLQEDGSFIDKDSVVIIPTIEEQLAQLKSDNLTLMDALATLYEGMLAKGTV